MPRAYISKAVRHRVAIAARHRCGYCLTSQKYTGAQLEVEHIIPVTLGGSHEEENLWLACSWCNGYKGFQIDGMDYLTGKHIPLFNPRRQIWWEHFRWSIDGTKIIGTTECGRATVEALQLNNKFVVSARGYWANAGWHPPKD